MLLRAAARLAEDAVLLGGGVHAAGLLRLPQQLPHAGVVIRPLVLLIPGLRQEAGHLLLERGVRVVAEDDLLLVLVVVVYEEVFVPAAGGAGARADGHDGGGGRLLLLPLPVPASSPPILLLRGRGRGAGGGGRGEAGALLGAGLDPGRAAAHGLEHPHPRPHAAAGAALARDWLQLHRPRRGQVDVGVARHHRPLGLGGGGARGRGGREALAGPHPVLGEEVCRQEVPVLLLGVLVDLGEALAEALGHGEPQRVVLLVLAVVGRGEDAAVRALAATNNNEDIKLSSLIITDHLLALPECAGVHHVWCRLGAVSADAGGGGGGGSVDRHEVALGQAAHIAALRI